MRTDLRTAAVVGFFLLATSAGAATTISGKILDETGIPVPGTSVSLTRLDSGPDEVY